MVTMSHLSATYNELCQMEGLGFPFSQEKVAGTRKILEENGIEIHQANPAAESDILLVHGKEYVEKIKNCNFSRYDKIRARLECIPLFDALYDTAIASVGCGLKALEIVGDGMSFALTQPPGHHAKKDSFAGFCVFNNAAIVAEKAKEKYARVGILDIDIHHGNGTEDIVKGDNDILFVSIHSKPMYPMLSGWRSTKNCLNYVIPHIILATFGTRDTYLKAVDRAVKNIQDFSPELLVVSAGFDTYERDPLGRGKICLSKKDYYDVAKRIASLEIPTVSLMEGGYAFYAIPEIAFNYCSAFER